MIGLLWWGIFIVLVLWGGSPWAPHGWAASAWVVFLSIWNVLGLVLFILWALRRSKRRKAVGW